MSSTPAAMRCASRSRLRLPPDTEWFARKGLQVLVRAICLSGTAAHGARGQVYTDDPGQGTPNAVADSACTAGHANVRRRLIPFRSNIWPLSCGHPQNGALSAAGWATDT